MLLHGVTGSCNMWRRVMPLLAPYHDVIAPTAMGHRGGAPATVRPAQIHHVVDETERCIDALGFDRVHLAGNSLGGWVALELARRGRALSVCALSPAGAWETEDRLRAARKLRATVTQTRSSRSLLPLLARNALFRRWALRDNAAHGERVSRAELLDLAADLLGCEVCEDLLGTSEQLMPLVPDCPVILAWSSADRIFPAHINAVRARELVPSARFTLLEGVGHVPMLDDPRLVAETILESTSRSARRA
jgi:pimeloyl-ACP methyl ester carboxylesterase